MCKVTISAFQMMEHFPTEDSARIYLELRRWNGQPTCPKCQVTERQYPQNRKNRPGFYECKVCGLVYTVRTGTIFERSHVPLHKWLFAIYLVVTARKGISSLQLSKEIGVSQPTSWFMLQRIRKACESDNDGNGFLFGVVEADEAYIGGKDINRHESKKKNAGRRGPIGKTAVLGMRERGGNVKAKVISNSGKSIKEHVKDAVCTLSTLCTDEHPAYKNIDGYKHKTVCHSAKQYVDGMAHTNGIESVWAILKRAFYGVYHSFSEKHMQLYLNEVCFRLNSGNVKIHTLNRIDVLVDMCFGKRLTFKALVAK